MPDTLILTRASQIHGGFKWNRTTNEKKKLLINNNYKSRSIHQQQTHSCRSQAPTPMHDTKTNNKRQTVKEQNTTRTCQRPVKQP